MEDMFELIMKTLKEAYDDKVYNAGKVHKRVDLVDFVNEHEEVQKLISEVIWKEAKKISGDKVKEIEVDYEDGKVDYSYSW